jgi:hypothetical protein
MSQGPGESVEKQDSYILVGDEDSSMTAGTGMVPATREPVGGGFT